MRQKRYDDEFRTQAVRLVKETGRSANAVAQEIRVSQTALCRWIREAEGVAKASAPSTEAELELARLRKENRQLRMERDFLRDAVG